MRTSIGGGLAIVPDDSPFLVCPPTICYTVVKGLAVYACDVEMGCCESA